MADGRLKATLHRLFRTRTYRAEVAARTPPGRAMGMLEHGFDCMHHMGAFVVVQAVCLEGPLRQATLRRALDALQARHPMLRVHVSGPGGIFEAPGTEPIPLQVVARAGADHWKSEAAEQVHRPIPYGTCPLLRVVWIAGDAGGELLLVSNHAILDGYSGTAMIVDLLDLCARIDAGEPLPPPAEPLTRVPPVDECLPEKAKGPKPKFFLPPLLPVDASAPAAQRRSVTEYVEMPGEIVARVQERCRAEGTTVNGALCAAAILAVRATLGTDMDLSLQSQATVREALIPPLPNQTLGCFISGVTTVHRAAAAVSFWDLARGVRQEVAAAIERGDHLTVLNGHFGRVHAFLLRLLGPRFRDGRTGALNVSNLGRLAIPTVYGARRLRAIYAGAGQHVLGSGLQVAAWSLAGTMLIACTHVRPLLSDAHAQEFVRALLRLLERGGEAGDFSLATLGQGET